MTMTTTTRRNNRKAVPAFGWLTSLHAAEPTLRGVIEAEHAARVAFVAEAKISGANSEASSALYLALKEAQRVREGAQDRQAMERLRQLAGAR